MIAAQWDYRAILVCESCYEYETGEVRGNCAAGVSWYSAVPCTCGAVAAGLDCLPSCSQVPLEVQP